VLVGEDTRGVISRPMTLDELLRRPGLDYEKLAVVDRDRSDLAPDVREEVEVQVKYEGYVAKQEAQVRRQRHLEALVIPADLRYASVRGLSTEGRERLEKVRPRTVGQASRVAGVTPADISLLIVHLEARRRGRSQEA